jgi:K(+)-stimulated pyrophosphate-energized sodium pump
MNGMMRTIGWVFTWMALAAPAWAGGEATAVADVRMLPDWWWTAPIAGVLALLMAFFFYRSIIAANPGNARMQEIAGYVREGAYAYLRRQYKVVGVVFIVLVALLSYMAFVLGVQHRLVPFAFLTGGLFSGLAGFIGMKTATAASSRTAQGASESLNRGLTIAFRAGSVMGLTVVGLALIDITGWFLYLYKYHHLWFGGHPMNLETITVVMLCFGMGASTQALFARVGGGIYTKAADVGADLVGKVEAGIPEDDPRNPATIADNVGDNVGDVAGMGADLYESYAGSILATAALGVAAATVSGWDATKTFAFLCAPMLLAAIGIVLSIFGIFLVRTREDANMKALLAALNRGIYVSSALIIVGAWFMVDFLAMPVGVFWSITIGVLAWHCHRQRDGMGDRFGLQADPVHRRAGRHRAGHGHHRRHRRGHAVHLDSGACGLRGHPPELCRHARLPGSAGRVCTAWASPRSACCPPSASPWPPMRTVPSPTTPAATRR